MKKHTRLVFLMVLVIWGASLSSCKNKMELDSNGLHQVNETLKSRFGEDAYYTKIEITSDKQIGTLLMVDVTEHPDSLKMKGWTQIKNQWEETSNITLIIENGKPSEYMFTLDEISLDSIGDLAQNTLIDYQKRTGLTNCKIKTITITAPDNNTKTHTTIRVLLEKENEGACFVCVYDLNGKIISTSD